jgi:hypothetical protein
LAAAWDADPHQFLSHLVFALRRIDGEIGLAVERAFLPACS